MNSRSEYLEHPLIDSIYEFKGLWDIPSQCGIKILKDRAESPVLILSDLYDINTGSTITEYCIPLLQRICADYSIALTDAKIFHLVPDESKYTFMDECYYEITLHKERDSYEPAWTQVPKESVLELIGSR